MKNKLILIALCVVIVASLAACTTVQTTPAETVRSISVSGTGEVYVVPDVAYINVGVTSQADNVTDALNQNTEQSQAIRQALTDLGVEDRDVQTSGFNVYPQQNYDMNGMPSDKTYVVSNVVNITVRDLSKLGDLLDAVVRSGANTINSITFDLLDKEAAYKQARDAAIADVRAQAEEIATASGVSLGDLMNISVYDNGSPTPVYEGKGGVMAYDSSTVPVAAGQMIISVSASATYLIK